MQFIFSDGFLNKCPGAILATNTWVRSEKVCKAITAILTLTNVRCAGHQSVYIIRTSEIGSVETYLAINASATILQCNRFLFLKWMKKLCCAVDWITKKKKKKMKQSNTAYVWNNTENHTQREIFSFQGANTSNKRAENARHLSVIISLRALKIASRKRMHESNTCIQS